MAPDAGGRVQRLDLELIEKTDRTAEDDEDMLRRAYAAAYHWDRAAGRGPGNAARADWLLAKVQLLTGRPELSLHHAHRCLATCVEHGLVDFDLAYAHEATGRALRALGRDDEAARLGGGQGSADRRGRRAGRPRGRPGHRSLAS